MKKKKNSARLLSLGLFLSILTSLAQAESGVVSLGQTSRRFVNSLPGSDVVIEKQLDQKSGKIIFISKSAIVKTADELVRLEENEKNAQFSKHGALTGSLRARFYKSKDSDLVDVKVYLRYPQPEFLDPTMHTQSQMEESELAIKALKPFGNIDSIVASFSGSLMDVRSTDSGSFTCRISKKQLDKLRFDKYVDNILEAIPAVPTAQKFSCLANSAYNPSSLMNNTVKGQGVNAATFETGLANTQNGTNSSGLPMYYPYGNFIGCLGLSNSSGNFEVRTPQWSNWEHSQQTFKCLFQAAPYANLFHAASTDYTSASSENFIINNNIQSVSMSVARCATYGCAYGLIPTIYMSEDANATPMARIDEWAYRAPYPIFSNPTANWGSNYEVNWQCYNAISVGNVKHTNLSHYEVEQEIQRDFCTPNGTCTQTRNPVQLYGGPNLRGPLNDANGVAIYGGSSGDREMPSLVAPGIAPITGEAMVDDKPCLEGPLWCGTSFSAPTLNGIVACVLSADTRMKNRPEVVRAVLLATAENVDGGEWDRSIDGRDGAGVVSGSSAVYFAQNHTEPQALTAAQKYAVSSANVSSSTAAGSTAKYNVLIPNPKPAGKHLRVVLTWSSNPVRSPSWNYLSDLDLTWSGPGNRNSASFNGNIEIIDIPAAELTAGSTYQATITLYANRIPSGKFLKYSIAWTWVKDHAQ
jgi:hypothetical protein